MYRMDLLNTILARRSRFTEKKKKKSHIGYTVGTDYSTYYIIVTKFISITRREIYTLIFNTQHMNWRTIQFYIKNQCKILNINTFYIKN